MHLSSSNTSLAEELFCADDSEPEASYNDDDHNTRNSESFPVNSPNFAIWPEPRTAPQTRSHLIEIQGAKAFD